MTVRWRDFSAANAMTRLFSGLRGLCVLISFVAPSCSVAFAQDSSPAPSAAQHSPPVPSNEFNTLLFHATFRIQGPSSERPGGTSFGTVFILVVPHKTGPYGSAVLVTAAHVLDGIAGDTASLLVRRANPDGTYTAFPFAINIRDGGVPLYVKHAQADVAAMYVALPIDVPITGIPIDFLADDQRLKDIELHPADEVFCLGFPLAATGPGGFPILRSGHIASYPLTPMETVKLIELDLYVLPGNSGGPVYYLYSERMYKGELHFGGRFVGILGLVVQSSTSVLPAFAGVSLNFGVIVPAPFIRETIAMLPPRQ